MMKPKIICLGMNEESEKAIAALVDVGADIAAIAGLPKKDAANVSDFVDHADIASRLGIAFLPVSDINAHETLEAFRTIGAEMLFVLGWSQLLSAEAIKVFSCGVVGSHPSELPYGRGRAPIPWTILEDRRRSAVTLFRMTNGVDDGVILKQTKFDIPVRPTARILYDLVAETLAHSFAELYCDFVEGQVTEVDQDIESASWRAKRVLADGWIDFRSEAEVIDRLVRAVSPPFPGAYSYLDGERAVFHSARLASGSDLRRKGMPGQVLARRQGMVLVQTGDVPLWLSEPILPVDRPVRLRLGDRFGFRIEDELHALRKRVKMIEQRISQ
ncbi:methionyl-tRNA formyltransferase [Litoreibacter albidus]|uniref:Methionyl-tRNA formyltransferase n=1 Tax=Litoreibacter albidus TaxID=670155 RepID=A0A1H3DMC8_9RHOB|nr:formyltransferase family protein [Litoreibacter albidus]SDX67500.1 methionyl-tRNA formyltransferase [Litoreibacter albidus]